MVRQGLVGDCRVFLLGCGILWEARETYSRFSCSGTTDVGMDACIFESNDSDAVAVGIGAVNGALAGCGSDWMTWQAVSAGRRSEDKVEIRMVTFGEA